MRLTVGQHPRDGGRTRVGAFGIGENFSSIIIPNCLAPRRSIRTALPAHGQSAGQYPSFMRDQPMFQRRQVIVSHGESVEVPGSPEGRIEMVILLPVPVEAVVGVRIIVV